MLFCEKKQIKNDKRFDFYHLCCMSTKKYPKDFQEFLAQFKGEDACRKHVKKPMERSRS